MQNFIGYIRVSSKGQKDNTSFENQIEIVKKFATANNGNLIIIVKEVKTGLKKNREGILHAIGLCKKHNAKLLVSKLDRLSREETLLKEIKNQKVGFVCATSPEMNELVIDMLTVVSNHEAKTIKERTQSGKKATIEKFGTLHHIKGTNSNLTVENKKEGILAIKNKALLNENNVKSKAFALALLQGGKTLKEIMTELNKNGFKTSTGGVFQRTLQVTRLIENNHVLDLSLAKKSFELVEI